ncbi:MAG: hypothetical protein JNK82_29310 [Myxococcaceae bacterium]|nr:hypothetical protein [Myxococcaceae bacterium]
MRLGCAFFVAVAVAGCGIVPGFPGQCRQQSGLEGSFCVPDSGVAAAGTALVLEIVNCGGCGSADLSCQVSVEAGVIDLSLAGETCDPPAGQACLAVCRIDRFTCTVPALAAGDYVVRSGVTTKPLQVRDAGEASCAGVTF